MSQELISIVIPVYNLEERIQQTLECLCSQTYSDIEIVVVDDGSCDSSVEIIRSCQKKDSRIRLIKQKNRGALQARLNGVKNVSGSWVCFVDGDDLVDMEMCSRMMNLTRIGSPQIVVMGEQMKYPDGRTVPLYGTGELKIYTGTDGLLVLLEGRKMEPGLHGKLYRKALFTDEVIEKCQMMDIRVNEDLFLNYLLFLEAKKIVHQDLTIYTYLLRSGSVTQQKSERQLFDPLKVLRWIYEDCRGDESLASLQTVSLERLIRHCLFMVRQKEYVQASAEGKRTIQKLLMENSRVSVGDRQLQIQIRLFQISPGLFSLFRNIFDRVTGRDRIYDIS